VVFRNGDKVFSVKGKKIYQWVTSLVPHLTGALTLEEMCAALGADQRAMVSKIVLALIDKGIVKNHVAEDAATLSDAVHARFKSQLELIDHYAERPLKRFKTFRQSRVILVGSGVAFKTLATSLMRNGLKNVTLVPNEGAREDLREIEAEAESLGRDGVKATLSIIEGTELDRPAEAGNFELVIYCSDSPSLRSAYLLQERCARTGRAYLPSIIFGGRSFIGPFVKPGATCCLLCGLMRLSSNLEERRTASLWRSLLLGPQLSDEGVVASGPTARMLGNNLAFEAFKILTDFLPPESDGGVLQQDLYTLATSRATLLAHPLCPACSRVDRDAEKTQLLEIAQGAHDQEMTTEQFLTRWYPYINSASGIFQSFADDDLVQLPLRASLLLAGDPVDAATPSSRIYTYSVDSSARARYDAVLEATRQYAQALPDQRLLVSASFMELFEARERPVALEQLSGWSGGPSVDDETRTEWLPAISLLTKRTHHVPAAGVYPLSPLNRNQYFERAASSAAAGITFRDVSRDGLVRALGYERLRDLEQGDASLIALDPQRLSITDPDLEFLIRSAAHMDMPLRLLEVAGPSPIHVVIANTFDGEQSAGPINRIGLGLSRQEAAKQALIALVGALQIKPVREAVGSLPTENLAHYLTLAPALSVPVLDDGLYGEEPSTIEAVESFLRERGRDAMFVNTTTQDIRQTRTLMTGTVLLTLQK
jgi:bacteriocin biosynthesis cyclodehydratase domain-containing protein